MPNWELSTRVKGYIYKRVSELSFRKVLYAQSDFPLTTAQIQFSIMEESKVHVLRRYIEEGTKTIEKHRQLRLALLRDKLPELPRGVILQVILPEWVVVERATHYGVGTTNFQVDERHYLVPEFEQLLTPTERVALVNWAIRAVRQKRLHEIIIHAVADVLEHHALTIAQLHQLWPMLATLMNSDPSVGRHAGDRVFYEMWRERFRAPVRPMARYKPTPEVLAKYGKVIPLADTVIAAGLILAPYEANTKVVTACVEHWEALDTDFKL